MARHRYVLGTCLRAAVPCLVLAATAGAQLFDDVFSRELIVANEPFEDVLWNDAHSRELTVQVVPSFVVDDVWSRELVVANEPVDSFIATDVSSREYVIANEPDTLEIVEAASRELTLHSNLWRSVRMHSGIGELGIVLNASATGNGVSGPTSDSRSPSVQIVEVDLGRSITIANPAALTVVGRTTTANVMGPPVNYPVASVTVPRPHVLRMSFTPGTLPEQACYNVSLLPGIVQEPIGGDLDVSFRSLYGDALSDGQVVIGDTLYIKARLSQVAGDQPHCDINMTGNTINLGDALAAKSQVVSTIHRALCP